MATFVEYLGIAVSVALVIYSIILHEIAHGYAAYRLGDPTAATQGRLTLNPIKHIDPFQTILVPAMILWASGDVSHSTSFIASACLTCGWFAGSTAMML